MSKRTVAATSHPPTSHHVQRLSVLGALTVLASTMAVVGFGSAAFAAVAAAPTGIDRVVSLSGTIDSTCGSGIPVGTPVNTTIQAAVTAATSGQQIYVCAGTYTENVTINTQNIDLLGPNWNNPSGSSDPATIVAASSSLPVIDFTIASQTDNGVRGFTIDGGTYGVLAEGRTGCCWDDPNTEGIVDNVFTGQTVASIQTDGLDSGNITGNKITPASGGDGIVLVNQYGLMNVQSNTITLSGNAVGVTAKQDAVLGAGNSTASCCVNIGGSTPALGNTITGGTTGVLIQSLSNQTGFTSYVESPLVQFNTLSDQSGDAIKLTDATLVAEIYDNTISSPGGSGVLLQAATANLGYDIEATYIFRNTITDAGRDGIEINGLVTTVFAGYDPGTGNTITNPTRDGISVTGFQTNTTTTPGARTFSAYGVRAFRNTITGAGDDGIDIKNAQYTYPWYNQISGAADDGLVANKTFWMEADYNTIKDNGDDGIHFDDTYDGYVWTNTTTGNDGDGIELGGGTQTQYVAWNTSNANGVGGIRLTGTVGPGGLPTEVLYNNVAGNTGLDCEDQMPGFQTLNGTYGGTTGNIWYPNVNFGATDDQPVGICMGNTLATSGTFRDGEVGNAYVGATPSVTNGTGPYTWTLPANPDGSPTLPAGLVLNSSTGQITGTPTTATTDFPVKLLVTDSTGAQGILSGTITIYPTLVASDGTKTGTTGAAITAFTPTVVGGNPDTTKTFTVASGSASALPAGLSLDPDTGKVTGTPTTPGTYTVTFHVTDNSPNMEDTATLPSGSVELPANADTYVVTFTITAGPVVADGSFPTATELQPYSSTAPTASGGDGGPYTWSTTSPLPDGLTLNPTTGVISGTPALGSEGTYPITLKATDGTGANDTFTADLVILPDPAGVPMANGYVAAATAALIGLGYAFVRRRRNGAGAVS